ncbi:MAG: hypothetical protein F6J87_28545 [Spirulina sp. SIO3F2]|nr:hypothetical protein [Spirulina sp. SIO3F2]
MESSGSSGNVADIPGHRWAKFLGTAIAFLTLAIPMLVIAYYSSADALQNPPPILPSSSEK